MRSVVLTVAGLVAVILIAVETRRAWRVPQHRLRILSGALASAFYLALTLLFVDWTVVAPLLWWVPFCLVASQLLAVGFRAEPTTPATGDDGAGTPRTSRLRAPSRGELAVNALLGLGMLAVVTVGAV